MSRHHTTPLPPELVREALRLLATGTVADRSAAAQLLARGWEEHEDARQETIPEELRPDGYNELEE
jgi:hypothetical protein